MTKKALFSLAGKVLKAWKEYQVFLVNNAELTGFTHKCAVVRVCAELMS